MTLAGSAARGAATTLGGQWIKFVVQVGGLAILARLLSPEDYGLLAMVTAIAGIANVLGDFGLSMASIQAKELLPAQRSNLFWLNFSLGLILATALYFLAGPIAGFYRQPALIPIAQVLASVFLFNAITAQFRAEMTRQLRFVWLSVTDILAQSLALGGAIWIAVAGGAYWALVAQQVGVAIVTMVFSVTLAKWLPGKPSRRVPMRSLIRFGVNTTGVQLVNYVSANADSVFLGRFWGGQELGAYDRAYQLFRMPLQQLAAPMTRVAFPILSKIDDPETYDRYVQRAQLVITYVVGGAFFVAAAAATPLIDLLLGPGWEKSRVIFAILAIGGVFQSLGYVYYWIFISKALTGLQFRYSIISRVVMVVLIAVGTIWGAYGVAAGSTVGLVVNWLILTFFAAPRTGVDVPSLIKIALRPIFVYATVLVIVWPLNVLLLSHLQSILQLLIDAGTACLVFAAWVIASPKVRRDLGLILRTVQTVRQR